MSQTQMSQTKVLEALRELGKIYITIVRFHNGVLTKKQKKSNQYMTHYMKTCRRNVDAGNTLEENEEIYKSYDFTRNGNTRGVLVGKDKVKVRYVGILCFQIIRDGYEARDELLNSETLSFDSYSHGLNKFLFSKMKQPFHLSICGVNFNVDSVMDNIKSLTLRRCMIITNSKCKCQMEEAIDFILKTNPGIKILMLQDMSIYYMGNLRGYYVTGVRERKYPLFEYPDVEIINDKVYKHMDYDND